jgi:hypothetical protein
LEVIEATKILGIFQGDIIVRTAIQEGMKRLYDDPQLLEYVFQSLAQDELTLKTYGERQIQDARTWFLTHKVPVLLSVRVAELVLPCITISLRESTEAEQTHGDVNYDTQESTPADWPPLTKPFTPTSYSPTSGMMQLPANIFVDAIIAPGQFVVTRGGNKYQIVDYLDDGLLQMQANIVDDFTDCVLKGPESKYVTTIESVTFKETYEVGIHANGEPVNTIYLHSIIKFVLLKYKQELLEARNFERTVLASSDLRRNMEMENELAFDRFITITGYCRQWWPKKKSERVQNVTSSLIVEPARVVNESDPALTDQGKAPDADTSWSVKV